MLVTVGAWNASFTRPRLHSCFVLEHSCHWATCFLPHFSVLVSSWHTYVRGFSDVKQCGHLNLSNLPSVRWHSQVCCSRHITSHLHPPSKKCKPIDWLCWNLYVDYVNEKWMSGQWTMWHNVSCDIRYPVLFYLFPVNSWSRIFMHSGSKPVESCRDVHFGELTMAQWPTTLGGLHSLHLQKPQKWAWLDTFKPFLEVHEMECKTKLKSSHASESWSIAATKRERMTHHYMLMIWLYLLPSYLVKI